LQMTTTLRDRSIRFQTYQSTSVRHVRNHTHSRSQALPEHLRPGPAPETPQGKIPRISRLMALAIHCDELLRTRKVVNQSALAEYAQITPARLTQILTLLNLAPDIQEQLLFLPRTIRARDEIRELHLRRIAMELDWGAQWPRVGNR